MPEKKKKINRARLDNAAKIYPAAMRKNRSNVFRLSATLSLMGGALLFLGINSSARGHGA